MDYRRLGSTGLRVSRLGLGCGNFGGIGSAPAFFGMGETEAQAIDLMDRAVDAGINFFDTANAYNNGLAETLLGRILKGRRQSVVLASKVGFKVGSEPLGLSRADILKGIDGSLSRLQTDYLDLYYLHVPDWTVPIEESLETMNELVRAGKVRYLANSNYASWQVVQMLWISQQKGWQPPYVSQPMYNVLARGIEQEYLAMCKAFGVSTIVYNPLAGGLLTGKQHRDRAIPGTRFDNNQLYLDRYWHPAYFDAVDELQAIGAKAGRSIIDLSLSWLLHHTASDCVILGASNMEQLHQNLEAFGKGALPPETVAAIDGVWEKLRGITPKYNR